MRRHLIPITILSALMLAPCGCGTAPNEPANHRLSLPRTPVQAPTTDSQKLVGGNTAFALDLYRRLADRNGNLFFSPYSISAALAMAYAGARGETEDKMAQTLHFALSQEKLHAAFGALAAELAQRSEAEHALYKQGFELNIANALWAQEGLSVNPEFLDLLAQSYGAGLQSVDFRRDPEGARAIINDWVSRQTEGRIQDIVPRGLITPQEVLALANAIYFNAPWQHKFRKQNTRDALFRRLDRSQVSVPMMRQGAHFRYADTAGCQAVELPYDGEETAMVILLPDSEKFREFESKLDGRTLGRILQSLDRRFITLRMPRFRYTSSFLLNRALSAMGMPLAFGPGADFSGITGSAGLYISFVIHKADVDVDEEGTVAAAGTVVGFRGGGAEPLEMTVDRPFIFLIRDRKTGTILFLGRVLDPTA